MDLYMNKINISTVFTVLIAWSRSSRYIVADIILNNYRIYIITDIHVTTYNLIRIYRLGKILVLSFTHALTSYMGKYIDDNAVFD